MCASGFAQQVVLTFTGRDATTNAYVQLSRIEITDQTQGWTETLTYPDTIAILTVGTGIEENAANAAFGLAQNNPNPFNGTTDVNLTVTESGPVTMEITDVNGRVVETFQETSLQSKSDTRGAINRAFAYGDAMTYKGFANVGGEEIEGEIVSQIQILSETITLPVQIGSRPCPGTATLTDIDGNTYSTVQLGTQCWMKENLKTTKYADDPFIFQGNSTSTNVAYWCYPDGSASNKATYGYLYNWKAVMRNSSSSATNPSNVQGICPTGGTCRAMRSGHSSPTT